MLLNEPPPDVIDHAPVVALPPTLAPLNVIADGVADSQTVSGPPAVAVFVALTLIVRGGRPDHAQVLRIRPPELSVVSRAPVASVPIALFHDPLGFRAPIGC